VCWWAKENWQRYGTKKLKLVRFYGTKIESHVMQDILSVLSLHHKNNISHAPDYFRFASE
jgi:hypothetical protein